MRCKDNKFNHGEINCNPNNIPDSNQLPAWPRLHNLQPQEGGSETPNQSKKQLRHKFTQNRSLKDVNREHDFFMLWDAPSRLKLQSILESFYLLRINLNVQILPLREILWSVYRFNKLLWIEKVVGWEDIQTDI
jgi:hypothetical protein